MLATVWHASHEVGEEDHNNERSLELQEVEQALSVLDLSQATAPRAPSVSDDDYLSQDATLQTASAVGAAGTASKAASADQLSTRIFPSKAHHDGMEEAIIPPGLTADLMLHQVSTDRSSVYGLCDRVIA